MLTFTQFIETLSKVKDWNPHLAFIAHCVGRRDIEILTRLWTEMGKTSENETAAYLRRDIVDSLAKTGDFQCALTALSLAPLVKPPRHVADSARIMRETASHVAASLATDDVEKLLGCTEDLEIDALVLYEGVMRGKVSAGSAAARAAHDRLAAAKHPLAPLPIALLPVEKETIQYLPRYGPDTTSVDRPFPYDGDDESEPVEPIRMSAHLAIKDLKWTETTYAARQEWIAAAVKNWEEESNGHSEARTFEWSLPEGIALASALPLLGLECLNPTDEVIARDGTAGGAFDTLFSAACTGGAYNSGRQAAYGRLLAWRSMAGLVGLQPSVPILEIARLAETCRWCLFHSSNHFFFNVAWDVGIACVNHSRHELAILAASDTD